MNNKGWLILLIKSGKKIAVRKEEIAYMQYAPSEPIPGKSFSKLTIGIKGGAHVHLDDPDTSIEELVEKLSSNI